MERVYFLCGNFENYNFIYAIRSDPSSDWYYFEEQDTLFDVHDSLPPNLENAISRLNETKPIASTMNVDQIGNYVQDGKFVFKGKELQTFIQLSGIRARARQCDNPDQSKHTKQEKSKGTHNLVFEAGKTNPAIFLKIFEKCSDIKTEKDKLYKLRDFVNENDKPEFSSLFFKGDWQGARSTFLQKYSMDFTQNKKKELSFSFEKEKGLRSFVARKMVALTTYTTLSVEHQLEVILSELPNEIANTFIIEDKLKCSKAEILEFCDVVQECCETKISDPTANSNVAPTTNSDVPNCVVQELEIFNFQEGADTLSDTSDTGSSSTTMSGRGKVKRRNRSDPPAKRLRAISEEFEFSSESDSSSQTCTIVFEG